MEIIAHNISEISVEQRKVDGYINATALTAAHRKATGQRKDIADWLRNKRVQQSLGHLSSITGISVIELHQVFQGSPDNGGGTWLHPRLSVRFAMWLSDDFGYQVENWVEQWMTTSRNPIAQQAQTATPELPIVMPTKEELDYMRSRDWEKAEMKGFPVSPETVKRKTGYGRATDAMQRFRELSQQRVIEGSEE